MSRERVRTGGSPRCWGLPAGSTGNVKAPVTALSLWSFWERRQEGEETNLQHYGRAHLPLFLPKPGRYQRGLWQDGLPWFQSWQESRP